MLEYKYFAIIEETLTDASYSIVPSFFSEMRGATAYHPRTKELFESSIRHLERAHHKVIKTRSVDFNQGRDELEERSRARALLTFLKLC
jgi:hypothetical protein